MHHAGPRGTSVVQHAKVPRETLVGGPTGVNQTRVS
jgi:hypothetical protein